MNFFEFFNMLGSNMWLYGGTFLLVLGILVFVHEWGHYIVAKMCGIHVETFSLGFGKELIGFNDKSGTRWKISLIPLGGYVKLFGDTDPASAGHTDSVEEADGQSRTMTDDEKKKAFFAKPVSRRAAVVFAGPAINYIFAVILMAGLYMFNGQPVTPATGAAIIAGSAADEAGFKPHDVILSIDGKTIYSFEDIRREMMIALDEKKHFVIERDGEKMDIYASPRRVESEDRFGFKNSRGLLGLISPRHAVRVDNVTMIAGQDVSTFETAQKTELLHGMMGREFNLVMGEGEAAQTLIVYPLAELNEELVQDRSVEETVDAPAVLFLSHAEANIFVKHNPVEAVGEAVKQTYVITRGTLEALGQMVTGTRSAKELGGIIRIGAIAGDMAQQGFVALILFTALLSINLGLINLFPIPLLDGGHLVFYAFEAAMGKPVPEQIQEYAFRAGLALLVCLMVFANINDIIQLVL